MLLPLFVSEIDLPTLRINLPPRPWYIYDANACYLACIVRIQFFTLIYTRMHFPVVNVNLAMIWFLPLVLFVRLIWKKIKKKHYCAIQLFTVHTRYNTHVNTVLYLYRWSGQKTGGKFLVGRFLELLTVNTLNQNNLVYRLLEGPSYISFTDSLNSVNWPGGIDLSFFRRNRRPGAVYLV
jgi:hypothetical protein